MHASRIDGVKAPQHRGTPSYTVTGTLSASSMAAMSLPVFFCVFAVLACARVLAASFGGLVRGVRSAATRNKRKGLIPKRLLSQPLHEAAGNALLQACVFRIDAAFHASFLAVADLFFFGDGAVSRRARSRPREQTAFFWKRGLQRRPWRLRLPMTRAESDFVCGTRTHPWMCKPVYLC